MIIKDLSPGSLERARIGYGVCAPRATQNAMLLCLELLESRRQHLRSSSDSVLL